MRILDLCRGVAGSGKSYWLRAHGLSRYALSADDIRLLYQSPVLQSNGAFAISQKNDNQVWELIFHLLEARMKRGEYTIIDATHSRAQQINSYRALCEKYRYRCRVLDFSKVTLETIQKQNTARLGSMGETHKYVPEGTILNMYERVRTQNIPSWVTKVALDTYIDVSALQPVDYNKYARVHVIGDLHGCLQPLLDYVATTAGFDSVEDAWIFVGDYVDRGIQNRELVEYLMRLRDYRNVLFLTGNHEKWLQYYANDEIDAIVSNEFKYQTMPQLESVDKKQLREWCRRFAQLAWLQFGTREILVTHGGIPCLPNIYIASDEIIHGAGKYEDAEATQAAFIARTASNVYQFHGHRNVFAQPLDHSKRVYNLCERVEFGGNLRVACVEREGEIKLYELPNTVYAPSIQPIASVAPINAPDVSETLVRLRARPKQIQEKRFDLSGALNKQGIISSFNFTRDTFYDKNWNAETILARGLFIDNQTGEVVARGYEKFFNINERTETRLENLNALQYPVEVYLKENGFLGLLGYDHAQQHSVIATKSSLAGDHVNWFTEILGTRLTSLQAYVAREPYCLVTEAIDPSNDPHIIEYSQANVVLLDAIKRDLTYEKFTYMDLVALAQQLGLAVKVHALTLQNYRELFDFYRATQEYKFKFNDDYVEGFVFEDAAGKMVKAKTAYYNTWKFMRSAKEQVARGKPIEMARMTTALQNSFVAWLKAQTPETLQLDIISLRNLYH